MSMLLSSTTPAHGSAFLADNRGTVLLYPREASDGSHRLRIHKSMTLLAEALVEKKGQGYAVYGIPSSH